jgi:hypothetical protein
MLKPTDKETYLSQVREYNQEALKLYNSVGTLQCPKCFKEHSEKVPADTSKRETNQQATVQDDTSVLKVFKTAKALLQHMDKCCPQLIPGNTNADVREAMEKMSVSF